MTYGRSRPETIVPYAEKNNIPLMDNALNRWSESKNQFLNMYNYNCPHAIDSGGFNVMANFDSKFPWSVEKYHNWLSQNNGEFIWAAVMDYACEERFDDLFSLDDRIQWTLDNTLKHFDFNPQYKVLPILQGRSFEDYIYCYDYLNDHGINTNHIGLGTVCRISNSQKIIELEKKIRDNTDINYIHGFGVKITALKNGAKFDSFDSQAWVESAKRGKMYKYNGTGLESINMKDDSKKRTVESFKNYYDFASDLMQNDMYVCDSCETVFRNNGKYEELVNNALEENYCEDCAESIYLSLKN